MTDRSMVRGPEGTIVLTVQRVIRATPERLFDAWTEPEQLTKWWGPPSVTCIAAEVDLKIGGRYRIANELPDGKVLWISGVFEVVKRPSRLIYTWQLAPDGPIERVTVKFVPQRGDTKVIIVHERILDAATRDGHEQGWFGCLDGVAEFLSGSQ
jgi:uncharacterized protein YndB with AHSA1/START domain